MLEKKSKHNCVTAMVSYKKGHHLKLIPFFKPKASAEKPESADKANGESPSNFSLPLLEHKVTVPNFDSTVIRAEDAKP